LPAPCSSLPRSAALLRPSADVYVTPIFRAISRLLSKQDLLLPPLCDSLFDAFTDPKETGCCFIEADAGNSIFDLGPRPPTRFIPFGPPPDGKGNLFGPVLAPNWLVIDALDDCLSLLFGLVLDRVKLPKMSRQSVIGDHHHSCQAVSLVQSAVKKEVLMELALLEHSPPIGPLSSPPPFSARRVSPSSRL